jgi:hypothetical protein
VAAVCDIIPERADAAAEKYGYPAFYSIADLLTKGPKLDADSMCTAGVENGGGPGTPWGWNAARSTAWTRAS